MKVTYPYTFTVVSSNAIDFGGGSNPYSNFNLSNMYAVIDATDNTIVYAPGGTAYPVSLSTGATSKQTLIQFTDPSVTFLNQNDILMVVYDFTGQQPTAASQSVALASDFPAYDSNYGKVVVGGSRDKFRDAFTAGFDTVNNWDVIQMGAGDIIQTDGTQAGNSYLKITKSSLYTDVETIIQTKKTFQMPCRLLYGLTTSQRLQGQEVSVELVGVDSNSNVLADAADAPLVPLVVPGSGPASYAITAATALSDTQTVTLTLGANHFFMVGSCITVAGSGLSSLNGNWVATAVTNNPISFVTGTTYTPGTLSTTSYGVLSLTQLQGVCQYTAVNIVNALYAGTTTTLVTAAPHNFVVGQSVIVTGVVPAGFSGTFVVTAIPTVDSFQYTVSSGLGAFTTIVGSSVYVTPTFSSFNFTSVPTISGTTVTITTTAAHTLCPGLFITVTGIAATINGIATNAYNGQYMAIAPTSGTTVTYVVASNVGSTLTIPGTTGTVANGSTFASQLVSTTGTAALVTNTGNVVTITGLGAAIPANSFVTVSGLIPVCYNGSFLVQTAPSATSITYFVQNYGGPITTATATVLMAGTVTYAFNSPHAFQVGNIIAATGFIAANAYGGQFIVARVYPNAITVFNGAASGTNSCAVAGVVSQVVPNGQVSYIATTAGSSYGVGTTTSVGSSPYTATFNVTAGGTAVPHPFVVGQFLSLASTTPAAYANGATPGTYYVSAVTPSATPSSFTVTILTNSVAFAAGALTAATITILTSGMPINIATSTAGNGSSVTLSTYPVNHGFSVGQTVVIANMLPAGYNSAVAVITAVGPSNTFTYANATNTALTVPGVVVPSGQVLLTTATPHGFSPGATVYVANTTSGTTVYNTAAGPAIVTSTPTTTTFTYVPTTLSTWTALTNTGTVQQVYAGGNFFSFPTVSVTVAAGTTAVTLAHQHNYTATSAIFQVSGLNAATTLAQNQFVDITAAASAVGTYTITLTTTSSTAQSQYSYFANQGVVTMCTNANATFVTTPINFQAPHGYAVGDRLVLYNARDSRLCGNMVVSAIPSLYQITASLWANISTSVAGGLTVALTPIAFLGALVVRVSPIGSAKNAASVLYDQYNSSGTVTQAQYLSRNYGGPMFFSGALTGAGVTFGTTTANTGALAYMYTYSPAHNTEIAGNGEYVKWSTVNLDANTLGQSATTNIIQYKKTQAIPDQQVSYKVRLRCKNLKMVVAVFARIVSISRLFGGNMVSVVTDVAHGILPGDFVLLHGINDLIATSYPVSTTVSGFLVCSVPTPVSLVVFWFNTNNLRCYGGVVERLQTGGTTGNASLTTAAVMGAVSSISFQGSVAYLYQETGVNTVPVTTSGTLAVGETVKIFGINTQTQLSNTLAPSRTLAAGYTAYYVKCSQLMGIARVNNIVTLTFSFMQASQQFAYGEVVTIYIPPAFINQYNASFQGCQGIVAVSAVTTNTLQFYMYGPDVPASQSSFGASAGAVVYSMPPISLYSPVTIINFNNTDQNVVNLPVTSICSPTPGVVGTPVFPFYFVVPNTATSAPTTSASGASTAALVLTQAPNAATRLNALAPNPTQSGSVITFATRSATVSTVLYTSNLMTVTFSSSVTQPFNPGEVVTLYCTSQGTLPLATYSGVVNTSTPTSVTFYYIGGTTISPANATMTATLFVPPPLQGEAVTVSGFDNPDFNVTLAVVASSTPATNNVFTVTNNVVGVNASTTGSGYLVPYTPLQFTSFLSTTAAPTRTNGVTTYPLNKVAFTGASLARTGGIVTLTTTFATPFVVGDAIMLSVTSGATDLNGVGGVVITSSTSSLTFFCLGPETVTTAASAGTVVLQLAVGQIVNVFGYLPASFNATNATVTAYNATAGTFSIVNSGTDTYTGTVATAAAPTNAAFGVTQTIGGPRVQWGYEGAYKVAVAVNANNTLTLASWNPIPFGYGSCGACLIKETDVRLHSVRVMDYSRTVVDVAGGIGVNDTNVAIPVSIQNINTAASTVSGFNAAAAVTVTNTPAVTLASTTITGTVATTLTSTTVTGTVATTLTSTTVTALTAQNTNTATVTSVVDGGTAVASGTQVQTVAVAANARSLFRVQVLADKPGVLILDQSSDGFTYAETNRVTLTAQSTNKLVIATAAFANSASAATVTLTTPVAHNLQGFQSIVVSGMVPAVLNGTMYISATIPSATTLTYNVVVPVGTSVPSYLTPNGTNPIALAARPTNVLSTGTIIAITSAVRYGGYAILTVSSNTLSVGNTITVVGGTGASSVLNGVYTVVGGTSTTVVVLSPGQNLTTLSTNLGYITQTYAPTYVYISSFTLAAGVVTATTTAAHGLVTNAVVSLFSSPALDAQGYAFLNGPVCVTSATSTTFTFNVAYTVPDATSVAASPNILAIVGVVYPVTTGPLVPNVYFNVASTAVSSGYTTVTTTLAHSFVVGQIVYFANATALGYNSAVAPQQTGVTYTLSGTPSGASGLITFTTTAAHGFQVGNLVTLSGTTNYNGSFVVQAVGSTTTFTVPTALTSAAAAGTVTLASPGYTVLAVASSTTFVILTAGTTTTTGTVYGQPVVYTPGSLGVPVGLTAPSNGPSAATTALAGANNIATVTVAAHQIVAGNTIVVAGCTPTVYNGTYTALSVTGTTVSYVCPGATGAQTVAGTLVGGAFLLSTTVTVLNTGVSTFTTTVAHGFSIGNTVTIAGCTPTGYNATYVIVQVASTTTFSVATATTGNLTVAGTVSLGVFPVVSTTVGPSSSGAGTTTALSQNIATITAAAIGAGATWSIGQFVYVTGGTQATYTGVWPVTNTSTTSVTFYSPSTTNASSTTTTIQGGTFVTPTAMSATTSVVTVAVTHNLAVGACVILAGTTPSNYSGTFYVTGVTGTTTFTVYNPSASGTVTVFGTVTTVANTITATTSTTNYVQAGSLVAIGSIYPASTASQFNGLYSVTSTGATNGTNAFVVGNALHPNNLYAAAVTNAANAPLSGILTLYQPPTSTLPLQTTNTTYSAITYPIMSAQRSNGILLLTLASSHGFITQQPVTIFNAQNPAFNGTYIVIATPLNNGTTTLTTLALASPGPNFAQTLITGSIANTYYTPNISIVSVGMNTTFSILNINWTTGTNVTVINTTYAHNLVTGNSITISGNTSVTGLNGTYTLTAASGTSLTFTAGALTGLTTATTTAIVGTVTNNSTPTVTATATTALPHNLVVGSALTIANAPTNYGFLNTVVYVTAVPTINSLQFVVANTTGADFAPSTSITASGIPGVCPLGQVALPFYYALATAAWSASVLTLTTALTHTLATGNYVYISNCSVPGLNGGPYLLATTTSGTVTLTVSMAFSAGISTTQVISGVLWGTQALPATMAQSASTTVTLTVASLLPTTTAVSSGVLISVANSANAFQNGTFTALSTSTTTITYVCGTSRSLSGSGNVSLLMQYCPANIVPNVAITSAARAANVATFTTAVPHGYTANQSVTVQNATNAAYNGTYQVQTVVSSNVFTVASYGTDVASNPSFANVYPMQLVTTAGITPVDFIVTNASVVSNYANTFTLTSGASSSTTLNTAATANGTFITLGTVQPASSALYTGTITEGTYQANGRAKYVNTAPMRRSDLVAAQLAGSVLTLTTALPHGFVVGDSVTLSSAQSQTAAMNTLLTTAPLTLIVCAVPSSTTFEVVRGNVDVPVNFSGVITGLAYSSTSRLYLTAATMIG